MDRNAIKEEGQDSRCPVVVVCPYSNQKARLPINEGVDHNLPPNQTWSASQPQTQPAQAEEMPTMLPIMVPEGVCSSNLS